MVAQLDTMEAFQSGYSVIFPEVGQQINHELWYASDYRTLWPSPTIPNGRMLYREEDQLKLPLFKVVSDFMANAAVSDMPGQSATSPGVLRWLELNNRMFERSVRRGTHYWSIHDKGVWTAEPGLITAINPIHYYRVGALEQSDQLVGHIIATPYYQRMPGEMPMSYQLQVPNRIRVLKLAQGVSTMQTFQYDGNIVGQPVTELENSPVTVICTAGDGDSWYQGARDVAARIMISETLLAQELSQYINRIRYLPASILANLQASRASGAAPLSPSALKAEIDSMVRPVIAMGFEDQPPVESMESIDIPARLAYHDGLYDQLYIAAGLPPSSFGIGIGRGESGYAREKAQDAASARIRAYRRDMVECLPLLVRGAGAPAAGKLSFNFATPPFQTRESQLDYALRLLQAGAITKDEVRTMLGWGPLPEELQQPERQAAPPGAGNDGDGNRRMEE